MDFRLDDIIVLRYRKKSQRTGAIIKARFPHGNRILRYLDL